MTGNSTLPYLSVVIPAYNEEDRLPHTLRQIWSYLEKQPYTSEIVVVDDGSTDGTVALVREFAGEKPIRVLTPGHQGKGGAVRTGMLEAQGDFLLMTDADLCTPIEDVQPLLAAMQSCDVAIGSRAIAGSVLTVRQPRYREILGRAGNLLIRTMALPGIHDTQCGFKLFRKEAARQIFSRSVMDGISFDVEVLYLARKLGYRIREVPIHWSHIPGSKMRMMRDSRSMIRDLFRIRQVHGGLTPLQIAPSERREPQR